MAETPDCPHCPDGHADPTSRPWGVFVSQDRDSDGEPTHLYVAPSAGQHVAESDAEWAWRMLNQHAFVQKVAPALWEHEYLRDVGSPPGFPWRDVREWIKDIYRREAAAAYVALLGKEN